MVRMQQKLKMNAKDTSASVEAGSDAITVTVGGEMTKKRWSFCNYSDQL